VLGPITIGDDSRVGANAVVVNSVPPNSVVVGIPGRVIARSNESTNPTFKIVASELVPDPVGLSLESLFERLHDLEEEVGVRGRAHEVRPSSTGIWSGDDFSI
jgi:serine O-acetyltransferase